MSATAVAVFALAVIAFVSQSRRLDRAHLTAPIVFTTLGTLIGLLPVGHHVDESVVHDLAEITLALVLFHDAAQVRPRQLESDAGLCARLLLIGLPLTVIAGYAAARLLYPGAGVWLALLLGASLAPTDAGLGAATVLDPVVPVRVRRILNVESGLNDGLATPVVLFAVAAAGGTHVGTVGTIGSAAVELALGVLIGAVLGALTGRVLALTSANRVEPGLLSVATLAVPLACYFSALVLHGNGFVAAFVSGTAFGAAAPGLRDGDPTSRQPALELTAWISVLLGLAVWGLFGVLAVAHLATDFTWRTVVFAVASLTVLRMLPVALALVGSGMKRPTVAFVGWFGPRGLASVIFALIAVEALPMDAALHEVMDTITLTVVLSVVLHGITAEPWARRYGAWAERTRPAEELADSVEPGPGRGRARRRLSPASSSP